MDQRFKVVVSNGTSDAQPFADPETIPPVQFLIRAFLVAVQIVVVIYLGQPGALFFYQLF